MSPHLAVILLLDQIPAVPTAKGTAPNTKSSNNHASGDRESPVPAHRFLAASGAAADGTGTKVTKERRAAAGAGVSLAAVLIRSQRIGTTGAPCLLEISAQTKYACTTVCLGRKHSDKPVDHGPSSQSLEQL